MEGRQRRREERERERYRREQFLIACHRSLIHSCEFVVVVLFLYSVFDLYAGPQSMRSSPPPAPPAANILAQDRKLHQLDVPMRAGLGGLNDATIGVGGIPVGVGSSSSSSWDDREVARQIAMLTEERDFLRKYVSRCEHELKAYQLQYPDLVGGHTAGGANSGDILNELSGGTGIEELPPWIGQAKYMSPLLVAYEARIEELMEKNQEQLVNSHTNTRTHSTRALLFDLA